MRLIIKRLPQPSVLDFTQPLNEHSGFLKTVVHCLGILGEMPILLGFEN